MKTENEKIWVKKKQYIMGNPNSLILMLHN